MDWRCESLHRGQALQTPAAGMGGKQSGSRGGWSYCSWSPQNKHGAISATGGRPGSPRSNSLGPLWEHQRESPCRPPLPHPSLSFTRSHRRPPKEGRSLRALRCHLSSGFSMRSPPLAGRKGTRRGAGDQSVYNPLVFQMGGPPGVAGMRALTVIAGCETTEKMKA